MSVSWNCCMLSGSGRSPVRRSPTGLCLCLTVCDLETWNSEPAWVRHELWNHRKQKNGMEEEKKYTFDRSPSRSSREGRRHISGRDTFMITQKIDIRKLETERRDYCGNWRRQSDGRMKPRVQCPSCSLHRALSNAFPIFCLLDRASLW